MRKRAFTRPQEMLARRMIECHATKVEVAAALGTSTRVVLRKWGALFAETKAKREASGESKREWSKTERDLVEAMAGYGIPEEDIARRLHISTAHLKQDFGEELLRGPSTVNARVLDSLFNMAVGQKRVIGPNGQATLQQVEPMVAAAIFWAKARLGWRDRDQTIWRGAGRMNRDGHVTPDPPEPEQPDLRAFVGSLDDAGRAALEVVLGQLGARSMLVPKTGEAVH